MNPSMWRSMIKLQRYKKRSRLSSGLRVFVISVAPPTDPVIMTHTGVGSGAFNTLFGKLLKIFAILLMG